ncbi:dihydrofolate synthase/folylpolyglutamate synthase, putative [Plasmodium gallinaceum]|uniref:Dihydrofolate synthase/folylpolyglutamate synthase, putative n=1 Tax=Plasmodium gallinaceum TaxID=5849 RepID=A0A1J1GRC1_PLAGA|nr:dihydrofolate synthase/folylpolyglutamate synthase, putative [Plasmodium gallinaceum]CRG94970.1 dihydrofolate synthase/folylpolyglutamate synthase, putative [Plasmodium gallinaceum]
MEEQIKTYSECLDKLYKTHSIKLGLDNSKKLSESFDNPCDKYKTIHIAGTNGKGSVCYKIYSCLKLKKYKVGLFSSPHIFSLRERIIVDDELINEEDLIFLVNKVINKIKKIDIKPSFFEIITMVAYLHFLNKEVDYAIIETGLGGRLDATNILSKPELIVITSIGYDHSHILGNELNLICNEKIGIFKKDTNVIIGPSVSIYKNVFEKAKELNCRITLVSPEPRGETYNEENSRIALEALKILNINVDNFLKSVIYIKPPLRLQYLAQEQIHHVKKKYTSNNLDNNFSLYPCAVILDVGHNETAIDRLCTDINYFHKGKLIRICISLTKPRNLNIFHPFIAHFPDTLKDVFYLPSINQRTYDFEEITDMINNDDQIDNKLKQLILDSSEKVRRWLQCNNKENIDGAENFDKLYKRGTIPLIVKNAFLECCKDNSILLIVGTFFMFDEVLNTFDIYSDIQDSVCMNEPSLI